MTPNYFKNIKQEIPLITDFEGMGEAEPTAKVTPTLRSHLQGVKRAGASMLRRTRDKVKTAITDDVARQAPTPGVDYSDLLVEAGPLRAARIDVQGEVIMRTGKSLLGLQVISHAGGASLGQVQDLIFSPETDEVLSLVLGENNLAPRDAFSLMEAQIVPWGEICNIGKDVIVVHSKLSRMRLLDYPRALHATEGGETLLSATQILTSDGRSLGTLADMCIDEATGLVKGYELFGGFVADSLHGKQFLPAPLDSENSSSDVATTIS